MLHILPNPIKLHPKVLGIECIPIQFHHTVLLVLFFIITSVWRQRSLFVFDDGNQFGRRDLAVYIGRNHVNKTARHGIVAHRLWEEKGNITEVFVDESSGIIAGFAAQNSFGRISPGKMGQGNPYQRFP